MFVAFYQGEELKSRLQKVCAGFHANVYPCPGAAADRDEMLKSIRTRLEDLNMVSKALKLTGMLVGLTVRSKNRH